MAALRLCCLLCFFTPNIASAEAVFSDSATSDSASSNSIHFIVLPYLHAVDDGQKQQPSIVSAVKTRQDFIDYNWIILVTSLADFSHHQGQLQILDHDQTSGYRLTDHRNSIIIPLVKQTPLLLPLQSANSAITALWIQYLKAGKVTWHSPSLTPNIAAHVLVEQKKTDRLAERMADRAFYFGYDTNDDALE